MLTSTANVYNSKSRRRFLQLSTVWLSQRNTDIFFILFSIGLPSASRVLSHTIRTHTRALTYSRTHCHSGRHTHIHTATQTDTLLYTLQTQADTDTNTYLLPLRQTGTLTYTLPLKQTDTRTHLKSTHVLPARTQATKKTRSVPVDFFNQSRYCPLLDWEVSRKLFFSFTR